MRMRPPGDLCPGTVLIVDDDEEMRAVLRVFLEQKGYRVVEVADAAAALTAVSAEPLDVAIVDKELRGASGLDLLPALRRTRPQVRVIFITAFGGPHVAEEARRRGADCYLEKPFRVGRIIDAVEAAAGHRHCPASPTP